MSIYMRTRRIASCAAVAALVSLCASSRAQAPSPVVVMETTLGRIRVELAAEKAPVTVKNFLQYVREKHYDGLTFHRVIPGFMIQGGGFTAEMKQRTTRPPIKNESANGLKNVRGSIAMARTPDPDSATAQFFVNVADNPFLDREKAADEVGYAVFGRVVSGMDVVDKIVGVPTEARDGHRDVPVQPVVIKTASVSEPEKK